MYDPMQVDLNDDQAVSDAVDDLIAAGVIPNPYASDMSDDDAAYADFCEQVGESTDMTSTGPTPGPEQRRRAVTIPHPLSDKLEDNGFEYFTTWPMGEASQIYRDQEKAKADLYRQSREPRQPDPTAGMSDDEVWNELIRLWPDMAGEVR